MEVILNINDLEYEPLFQGFNMYIENDKIITVSGANNCGKTTLIRILNREISLPFNIILDGKNIRDYSYEEYFSLVQTVYPLETYFEENTPREELLIRNADKKEEQINKILIDLNIDRIANKEFSKCSKSDIIKTQIALAVLNAKKLVLIDGVDSYLSKEELLEVYNFLKKYTRKYHITAIITSTNLEASILSDELYIIFEKNANLHGEPLSVLSKDNVINKAGLKIPFMIDLSVKLRDYDLIQKIELDKQELVDTLWK